MDPRLQNWGLYLSAHATADSYLVLFLIGFTYSLYHCVGMCGGFVVAYSSTCSAASSDRGVLQHWPLHLLFNLGRVVSYSFIGSLMGLAGSWAEYYGRIQGTRLQGIVGIAGGALMIVFGLSLIGLLRLPPGAMIGGSVVRRLFGALLRSQSPWRTFPMGLLVGTVPCGLVYSMSSYALASGSPLGGALAMASFGLGTIPAMFCFGFVSSAFSVTARKGLLWIAVGLTIVMGVEAIHRGLGNL